MKIFLLAIAATMLTQFNYAQVSIATPASPPDASAMLDIKSTNKGFLMPRVTNRTNITSPATGLIVYETASNAVWLYNGTAWGQLGSGAAASGWLANGTHIYNSNSGNVGIGIAAPTQKLEVAGNLLLNAGAPTLKFKRGSGILSLSTIDFADADDAIGFRQQYQSSYFKLGRPASIGSENDLVISTSSGFIGIGADNPGDRLDVTGNIRLSGESRLLKFETGQATSTVTKYAPGVRFIRADNTPLAALEYVDTIGTNFLRLRTGSAITNDFVVTTGHDVCIGGSNPNAKLEVRGIGEVMRIHAGTDPLLQFSTGNAAGGLGLPLVRKGFIDVNGNDFRIGTNAENDAGNFIARVNGNDVLKITPSATVGIGLGTTAPAAKLHVAGNILVKNNGEVLRIDGLSPTINFFHNGGSSSTAYSFLTQSASELYIGANGRLRFDAVTGVTIGPVMTGANNYKLAVGGSIVCEELRVKLRADWADYVFKNDYKLMPLPELQKFIDHNSHLPNIPSAAVIEKEGISVGDMQKRQMEKIEELTLYILDLQKQIDELKKDRK